MMSRIRVVSIAATLLAIAVVVVGYAQQAERPPFATTKVEGTNNVYVFRNGNHQVLAMDWDRMIPGHPGQPGDRLGTKKDVEDQLKLLQTASAEMKQLAQDGKCWDAAEKEFKLAGYENWPGYQNNLQFIARRYCSLWGRGT